MAGVAWLGGVRRARMVAVRGRSLGILVVFLFAGGGFEGDGGVSVCAAQGVVRGGSVDLVCVWMLFLVLGGSCGCSYNQGWWR